MTATREPEIMTAGNSYAWTRQLASYPASAGWSLSYSIVNRFKQYDIASVADGDSFDVTVATTDSADYAPGDYRLFGFVEKAGQRIQIYRGDLCVSPDVASPHDSRTYAESTLEAIESLIAKAATKDQQSVMVDGQSLVRRTYAELISLRDRFKREVAAERRASRRAAGRGSAGRVQVRFK